MKLDKRACRHAANVPLNISLNAGVLYTDRVKYLVTAAVKLLGGHTSNTRSLICAVGRNFYSGSSKIMCIRFQRSGLPI